MADVQDLIPGIRIEVANDQVSEAPPGRPKVASFRQVYHFLYGPFTGGEEQFRIGNVVRWRKGYRNARFPNDGEECVVTQVMEQPPSTGEDGSAELGQRLNIALGFVSRGPDGSMHFIEYLFDSRRFESVDDRDIESMDFEDFTDEDGNDKGFPQE